MKRERREGGREGEGRENERGGENVHPQPLILGIMSLNLTYP